MTVLYIKPRKEKGYLTVGIKKDEEKVALTLNEKEYSSLGPFSIGDTLVQDTYDELVLCDMTFRARKKALNILAFGDNSKNRLLYKLVCADIRRDIAEKVVSEMEKRGYLDDKRQIEREVFRCYEKLFGPIKITSRLHGKGYKVSDIQTVMTSLQKSGQIDFELSKQTLLDRAKKDGLECEEIKKLLYKHGYTV